jgi:hypothetical protein
VRTKAQRCPKCQHKTIPIRTDDGALVCRDCFALLVQPPPVSDELPEKQVGQGELSRAQLAKAAANRDALISLVRKKFREWVEQLDTEEGMEFWLKVKDTTTLASHFGGWLEEEMDDVLRKRIGRN